MKFWRNNMGKLTDILNLATSRRVLITLGASLLIIFARDIFKIELTPEQAADYMDKALIAIAVLGGSLNLGLSVRDHK